MKAVLKLVLTYFTGTPLLAVTMALGVARRASAGALLFLYLPPLLAGQGGRRVSRSVWRRSFS